MKRFFLLVLCFLFVTASANAGAAGNSAKQENPRQAGKSNIIFYDVESTHGDGYGRLVIDTQKKTFTFIGQDFTPYQEIHLQYKATNGLFAVFAKGKSTPSGNLHVAGNWDGTLPTEVVAITYYYHVPIEAFSIENDGWFVIKVGCHYSTDLYTTTEQVWHECPNKSKSVALAQDKYAHLDDLGVPLGADVRIKVFVEMGPDQTSDETFTYAYGPGNNPGYCHGNYTIEGKVWNPILTYWGTVCESEPGKGDWWTSDLP